MAAKVSVSKSKVENMNLFMESDREELTPEQKLFYNNVEGSYQNFKLKINEYISKFGGELILGEGDCFAFQVPFTTSSHIRDDTLIASTPSGAVQRKKRISVRAVTPASSPPPSVALPTGTPSTTRTRGRRSFEPSNPSASPIAPQTSSAQSSVYVLRGDAKQKQVSLMPPGKAVEWSAIGGLQTGVKNVVTAHATKGKNTFDATEMSFGKQAGKTFPSLVVFARPQLHSKSDIGTKTASERAKLDTLVKSVLVFQPNKFTEWLLQKGLLKADQVCPLHLNLDGTPVKMKLGLYSDISKFPLSGGYVWISDCCPQLYISVFNGSIFEGAIVTPAVILKLIYHWACQTNVQNIVQWVKVDNVYIKHFFTLMRSVCTQALHEKFEKMGGPNKVVELGVISLGTTSQDGNMRQVKVEVLGVVEMETKKIRLSAVEPVQETRSMRYRFLKILDPLRDWVHEDSIIVIDGTIDFDTLRSLGFQNIKVAGIGNHFFTNNNIMEYLRKVIPRMLQNTLSLLSRSIIQQFLDELTWRETWGQIPAFAFSKIVEHLAEQTALPVTESLIQRLNNITHMPFKRRPYSSWTPVATQAQFQSSSSSCSIQTRGRGRPNKRPAETPADPAPKRSACRAPPVIRAPPPLSLHTETTSVTVEADTITPQGWISEKRAEIPQQTKDQLLSASSTIDGDTYYYGVLPGETVADHRVRVLTKCCICLRPFWDSMVLMKHLLLHCQTRPALQDDIRKAVQCNQCFIGTNTLTQLKAHNQMAHATPLNQKLICRICEKIFVDELNFFYHMHRTHVALELPYGCGVCKYRSSAYKDIVEHFTQVHKGSHLMFCPYCLKVVSVLKNNTADYTNVVYYVNHLQKHQSPELNRKCPCCRLSFFHRGLLKKHLEVDHRSFADEPGVIALSSEFSSKIPDPALEIVSRLNFATSVIGMDETNLNCIITEKFVELTVDETLGLLCVECGADVCIEGHFSKEHKCFYCNYLTYCEQAMIEHTAMTHKAKNLILLSGKPLILLEPMYCMCGYSSCYGYNLVKHLIACDKRTVYPTEAVAKSAAATIRRMDMAKLQMKMKETEETHGMLNVLGLMRKSPEQSSEQMDTSNSTDNNVVTIDDEDNEDEITASTDQHSSPIPEISSSTNLADNTEAESSENSSVEKTISKEVESVDDIEIIESTDEQKDDSAEMSAKPDDTLESDTHESESSKDDNFADTTRSDDGIAESARESSGVEDHIADSIEHDDTVEQSSSITDNIAQSMEKETIDDDTDDLAALDDHILESSRPDDEASETAKQNENILGTVEHEDSIVGSTDHEDNVVDFTEQEDNIVESTERGDNAESADGNTDSIEHEDIVESVEQEDNVETTERGVESVVQEDNVETTERDVKSIEQEDNVETTERDVKSIEQEDNVETTERGVELVEEEENVETAERDVESIEHEDNVESTERELESIEHEDNVQSAGDDGDIGQPERHDDNISEFTEQEDHVVESAENEENILESVEEGIHIVDTTEHEDNLVESTELVDNVAESAVHENAHAESSEYEHGIVESEENNDVVEFTETQSNIVESLPLDDENIYSSKENDGDNNAVATEEDHISSLENKGLITPMRVKETTENVERNESAFRIEEISEKERMGQEEIEMSLAEEEPEKMDVEDDEGKNELESMDVDIPTSEKEPEVPETAGSLIAELEGMINTTETSEDDPDFLSDLIGQ